MKRYTLVQDDRGRGERYEALYADGHLIATSDDGPMSAAGVLEAIASDNIAVVTAYVNVNAEYGDGTVSMDGWPESLDEIPEDARVT